MRRPAIVIVTFKRQQLLAELFDSILELTVAPWRVVVVDNENSSDTARLVADFSARAGALWGPTTDDPDAAGGVGRVVYDPMQTNTGGSGGFSEGVRRAFELGAEWFWVMDDDVCALPEALEVLGRWSERADAIQGQRYDFDGGPFFWQYRFNTALGIYNPLSRARWEPGEEYKECNALCFEGGCFSRRVVQKIGLPDPRFFIYWDDALYGYLASKVCPVLLVPDYVLRRRREVPNKEIGTVRQLNSTSDMTRFYITRNRGFLARYYRLHGDYHPAAFGVGTFLTFAKEIVRILIVDRGSLVSGTKRLFAGWREQRRIQKDPDWEPMPPLG
ncbi:glycosyltransferase [Thermophilibacter immobilis]|jgi:GT2 family glycosyltransferase|uniref:Glycosyltransferase n=1 Tax=Thermophilibacter immobilis TaxID=2779519 RepID=A0A7S7M9N6_9ACTN|nr:glycosyltransferase [Thermophilibacter immobilis]QOY60428.1 glycosyltransferase [Thermophilibacter immobilis]